MHTAFQNDVHDFCTYSVRIGGPICRANFSMFVDKLESFDETKCLFHRTGLICIIQENIALSSDLCNIFLYHTQCQSILYTICTYGVRIGGPICRAYFSVFVNKLESFDETKGFLHRTGLICMIQENIYNMYLRCLSQGSNLPGKLHHVC